jgi:regulator of replication initiation timing
MDSELAGLEEKVATLLSDYHRLRAENESLRRELARAQEQNRSFAARITAASARLDGLLQQLPVTAN